MMKTNRMMKRMAAVAAAMAMLASLRKQLF